MIGEKIRQTIDSQWKGTRKDLCEKIGISVGNLYELYKRESVETKYLVAIADVLGMKVSDFFEDGNISTTRKSVVSIQNSPKNEKEVDNLKDRYIEKLEGDVKFLKEMIQQYGLGKWLLNRSAIRSDSNDTVLRSGLLTVQP